MINVLNLDNEIVMQLTEADITKLLRVARAVDVMIRHGNSPEWKRGLIPWREIAEGVDPDDLVVLGEALKEVGHLLG